MTTTETKTSTTPGPWERPGTDGGEWVICSTDKYGKKRTLAHVYSLANSRLIRAAPELLAALERVTDELESFGPDVDDNGAVSRARTAIAAAKGGAQ